MHHQSAARFLTLAGIASITAIASLTSSCKTTQPISAVRDDAVSPTQTTGPKLCAAVRGNGNLIFAHFAGLSRVIETYGMLDAIAGGSSGSVSSFLYESIVANPMVHECNGAKCSAADEAARASLLLKSLQGYIGYIANTDEAVAVKLLVPIAAKIKAAGIDSLEEAETVQARDAMMTLFKSPEMRDVINPELIAMLSSPTNPEYQAREAYLAVNSIGEWSVADPKIFFRPGAINFPAIAKKVGRMGSFLAGYEPVSKPKMKAFLDACAVKGRGKQWTEIHGMPAVEGSTCGELFLVVLHEFRTKLLANESLYPSRINETIGKHIPALVMTSILSGEAVGKFKQSRQNYMSDKPLDFNMNFDDLRIGFWGSSADLATVGRNDRGYGDLKTKKFMPLGEATWAKVLSYSPAEPSLARGLELGDDLVSTGGWPDLHPVLALKNLGCQEVVYITRRSDESDFATGVAKHLGMTEEQQTAIYDLNNADSSFSKSISEAGAVLCSNWNIYETQQVAELSDHVYNSPIEAHSAFFKDATYENISDKLQLRGCTPGAPVETVP